MGAVNCNLKSLRYQKSRFRKGEKCKLLPPRYGPRQRKFNRTARKSGQRFHQFHVHCDVRLGANIGICHMFIYHHGVLWHLISIGIYETIIVSLQWELKKCMLNTLKKRYVFEIVSRFATAPAILFHHFNLRTIFALIYQHFDVYIAIAKP